MDTFSTLAEFRSFMADLPEADLLAKSAATERNSLLTKPAGALGDLENLAISAGFAVSEPLKYKNS